MSAWPSDLPFPRAEGAGLDLGKTASRFETDAGVARQRAISTAAIDTLRLTYRCTATQRDALLDFYRGAAGQGGVWFDYTNPFTLVDGQARFLVGQEPRIAAVPPKFDVAVVLEFIG